MRVLIASAFDERFAFESAQVDGIAAWPPEPGVPRGSLHQLAGVGAEEPEPRAVLGRAAASGARFALRVPGALREAEVEAPQIHPVPPPLPTPPWVRGFLLHDGVPAPLLDLPALGDAVLQGHPLPETAP